MTLTLKDEKPRFPKMKTLDHEAFMARTGAAYSHLKERAAEKRDKNKRIIRYAQPVPFTVNDLRPFVRQQIGIGGRRCPYCDYNVITAYNFVLDHIKPITQGGDFSLENTICCCADCNWYKGGMTADSYRALLVVIYALPAPCQKDVLKRLKGGGAVWKGRSFTKNKEVQPQPSVEADELF